MATLPAYLPRYTNLAWGGITFDGLAEDFLTITPNSNITTTSVGSDGARGVTLNPDYTCTVSITLQQTSAANQKLARMVREYRTAKKVYYYNFTIDDPSGSLVTLLKEAYLEEGPEQGYSNELGERVWTFNAELNYDELASGVELSPAIASNVRSEVDSAIALFTDF